MTPPGDIPGYDGGGDGGVGEAGATPQSFLPWKNDATPGDRIGGAGLVWGP